jgi:predicted RNase H-like HicB family nuclease
LSLEFPEPFGLNEGMSSGAQHQVELSAVLWAAPEGGFSALNPETGTASQGDTEAEALANLVEATELYLEEFPLPAGRRPVITTFRIADVA